MGAINLPVNIQDGDDLEAADVMSNFQSITQAANGNLQANSNVQTATAVTQPGNANGEGVAATLARSDHKHIIQSFENLAADPTTGNFTGRVYWNTNTNEFRYCTNAAGSGTFGTFTPSATELVVHAAQHKDGGHDPIADNTLTDHMFAAKANIFTATLGSDHASISSSAWSTILDLTTVTTTGQQTLGIYVNLLAQATAGTGNAFFRVVDVTASNTTIFSSNSVECDSGIQTQLDGFFYYSTPAGGARTLRIQAGASNNTIDIKQPSGHHGDTFIGPTIQAAIL